MQMDQTTQQNAALVEEASAASQAIVEQAQALNAMIDRYDVGGEAVRPVAKAAPAGTERRSGLVRGRIARHRPLRPRPRSPHQRARRPATTTEWKEF